MHVRKILPIMVEILFSFIIIILSLRTYIFGNGFFDYADQYWNPTIYSYHLVWLTPTLGHSYVSILVFTRSSIAGLGVVLTFLSKNPVVQEKIFIIYTFLIYILAIYILSWIITEIVERGINVSLNRVKKEVFKAVLVLAVYSNIALMNLTVDGGTWADNLIMVFIAISIAYSIYSKSLMRSVSLTVMLMTLSVFTDPDYFLAYIIVFFVSSLIVYRKSLIKGIALGTMAGVLSMPSVFFIIYGRIVTATGTVNPLAGRPVSTVLGLKTLNPITSILMIGHLWSTYAISPPSVLLYAGKEVVVPYFGNIVLLPSSWITILWFVSLVLYPLIALLAVFLKRYWKITIPFFSMWLVGFILSQWWKIPGVSEILLWATRTPLIGSAIGTTLSLGGHYMNIEGMAYSVLLSVLFISVLTKTASFWNPFRQFFYIFYIGISGLFALYAYSTVFKISYRSLSYVAIGILLFSISLSIVTAHKHRHFDAIYRSKGLIFVRRHVKQKMNTIIAVFIVFIIIMVGWQAFNGSFYPERSFSGTSAGVLDTNAGPYSPVYVPQYVINSYNNLTSNHSYETVFFAPQMPNNLPNVYDRVYLNYLIDGGYAADIPYFLHLENIRYLITYDDPSHITAVLNESGLYHYTIGDGSYVYVQNSSAGQSYDANIMLNYPGHNYNFLQSYSVFESLNLTPVFSNSGAVLLSLNNYNGNFDIFNPLTFSGDIFDHRISAQSAFEVNKTVYTVPSLASKYIADNWYIFNSANHGVDVKLINGTLSDYVTTKGINLYYGNATTPGHFIVVPVQNFRNVTLLGRINFEYRTSTNFTGTILSKFGYSYYSGQNSYYEYSPSVAYNRTTSWTNTSFSFDFPLNTAYFSPHILLNGTSGQVYLRNVSFEWITYKNVPQEDQVYYPLSLYNHTVELKRPGNYYVLASGNGTINDLHISSIAHTWLHIYGNKLSIVGNATIYTIIYTGNNTIHNLIRKYTILNTPYSNMIRMVTGSGPYKSIPTLTGKNVFPVGEVEPKFLLKGRTNIILGYALLLIYITSFFILTFSPCLVRKFKRLFLL